MMSPDYAHLDRLTERELQVLRLLAEGLSMQEAGLLLGLSERTVRSHATRIYSKLRVSNRVSAVLAAQQLGLLPTSSPALVRVREQIEKVEQELQALRLLINRMEG